VTHAEFLADLDARRPSWPLTDWGRAVRLLLGIRALWQYRIALAFVAAPALLLLAHGLSAQKWGRSAIACAGLWGFATRSTQPTGVGMAASLAAALAGAAWGLAARDGLLFFGGLLPGLTWFAGCAVLGVTSSFLIDALKASEPLFEEAVRRGILTRTEAGTPTSEKAASG
jgi:hypothetical protein